MPTFDSANQNKVHKSVLEKVFNAKLREVLANTTLEQLAQIAKDILAQNVKRMGKGQPTISFIPKRSPNGSFIVSYPKPIGKIIYVTMESMPGDNKIFWKLLDEALHAPEAKEEGINTVNVIKMGKGVVDSLNAWPETPEGNKAAEEKFIELIKTDGCASDEVAACVEDGYYRMYDVEILLVHSS